MKYSNIIILIAMLFSFGCELESDFLTLDNPNEVTNANFFKTNEDAIAAVNAAYTPLQSGRMYHNSYFNMMDVGIEMSPNSNMPGSWHISTYSFDSNHETISNVWIALYQIIGRANFAIDGINRMDNLEATLKNRLLGEAHFLRGWAYFELVFNYGRVPIVLNLPESSEQANTPRSQTELEVYQLAIDDFKFAEENLPLSFSGPDKGRVTKGSAVGYLGKIHLYMASPGVNLDPQGYQKAEAYFARLVDGNEFAYSLVPDYKDNHTWFNENNSESLFEVQYTNIGGSTGAWADHDFANVAEGTNRARTFGYLTWFNAVMNPSFISRYNDEDPRLRYTAYGPPTPAHPEPMRIFNDIAYNREDWVSRKYGRYDYIPANQENGDSPINFRVLRYADILLMYAEAINEQNKATNLSIPYINEVRQRPSVDLPPLALNLSQEETRQAIMNERLWELSLEQIRKKDVLRWGQAVAEAEFELAGISAFNYSTHRYLPIPLVEIDVNAAISNADQNPGY